MVLWMVLWALFHSLAALELQSMCPNTLLVVIMLIQAFWPLLSYFRVRSVTRSGESLIAQNFDFSHASSYVDKKLLAKRILQLLILSWGIVLDSILLRHFVVLNFAVVDLYPFLILMFYILGFLLIMTLSQLFRPETAHRYLQQVSNPCELFKQCVVSLIEEDSPLLQYSFFALWLTAEIIVFSATLSAGLWDWDFASLDGWFAAGVLGRLPTIAYVCYKTQSSFFHNEREVFHEIIEGAKTASQFFILILLPILDILTDWKLVANFVNFMRTTYLLAGWKDQLGQFAPLTSHVSEEVDFVTPLVLACIAASFATGVFLYSIVLFIKLTCQGQRLLSLKTMDDVSQKIMVLKWIGVFVHDLVFLAVLLFLDLEAGPNFYVIKSFLVATSLTLMMVELSRIVAMRAPVKATIRIYFNLLISLFVILISAFIVAARSTCNFPNFCLSTKFLLTDEDQYLFRQISLCSEIKTIGVSCQGECLSRNQFGSLKAATGNIVIAKNQIQTFVEFPQLKSVSGSIIIANNSQMGRINLESISSVESDIIVFKNLELSNFELPKFSKTHSVQIQANPRLESFSMGSLETNVSITALKIFRNSALNSIEISGKSCSGSSWEIIGNKQLSKVSISCGEFVLPYSLSLDESVQTITLQATWTSKQCMTLKTEEETLTFTSSFTQNISSEALLEPCP